MTSDSPALATWLLHHLLLGKETEALAGDLLEEFRQRRSAPWYWRQVLKAIALGFANSIRGEWFAILFAIAWIIALSASWGHIMTNPRFQSLIGFGVGWDWPTSTIYFVAFFTAATTITLWLGLTFYVAVTHRFDARAFLYGMLLAFFLDIAINVGGLLLGRRYQLSIYLIEWLPLFFTLLLSIFIGRARRPSADYAAFKPR